MVRAWASRVRPAWVGATPWRPRTSKFGAEGQFELADAGRGRRQRQIKPRRAMRDAAGLDDMAKQIEIGEIEAHGGSPG